MKNQLQKQYKVKLINEAIKRGSQKRKPKAELLPDGRIEYTMEAITTSGKPYRIRVTFNEILMQLQGDDMRKLHNIYGAGALRRKVPKITPKMPRLK